MNSPMTDFDLRPRRLSTSITPMLSTLEVDDEGDTLAALVASDLAPLQRFADACSDARHTALLAIPSALCRPADGELWLAARPAPRKRHRVPADRMMFGTMISAALALLFVAAAMFWRIEHPRIVHVEDARAAVQAPAHVDVDAVSSASRR